MKLVVGRANDEYLVHPADQDLPMGRLWRAWLNLREGYVTVNRNFADAVVGVDVAVGGRWHVRICHLGGVVPGGPVLVEREGVRACLDSRWRDNRLDVVRRLLQRVFFLHENQKALLHFQEEYLAQRIG